MTYRSADAVFKERLADLERELAEIEARDRALTAECAATERTVKELDERLALSGVGGAARGPTFDRISVLVAGHRDARAIVSDVSTAARPRRPTSPS